MKRSVPLALLLGFSLVSCPNPTPSCGFDACRLELRTSVNGLTMQSTSSATVGVTVSTPNGYAGTVDLTTRNLPSGVTAKFVPDRVSLGGASNGLSVLTLTSAGGAATSQPLDLMIVAVGQGVGVQQALKLTITPDGTPNPNSSLSVSPRAVSLVAGGAVQVFSTKLVGTGTINWSLNPNIGTLSSPTGTTVTYTPPASLSADTPVKLTATLAGTSVSDTATLTVSPAPPPASGPQLDVRPKTVSVNAGGAGQTFSTTLQNASGTINWSLNPNLGTLSSPTGGTVIYTPPGALAQNTPVTLTATVSGTSLSDVATITVIAPPPPPPTINVSPRSASVTAGAGAPTFTATVQNSSSAVNWTISPNVGTLSGTPGASVSYTPPATIAQATTVTLTATVAGTTVFDTVTVNVAPVPPPGAPGSFSANTASSTVINLNWVAPASMTGYTLERHAGSDPYVQVTAPSASATTYTDSGLAASTVYTYRLTATNTGGAGPSVEASATTSAPPPPPPVTLTVSPKTVTLNAGGATQIFTANLQNSSEPITWSLGSPSGTISSTTGTSVTYTSPATPTLLITTLTASVPSGASDTVQITINGSGPPPAPTITIDPNVASLDAGGAAQLFTATLLNSSETITWALTGTGRILGTTGTTTTYTSPVSALNKTATLKASVPSGASASVRISIIGTCASAQAPQLPPPCP